MKMKKSAAFLISGILFWGTISVLRASRNGLPFLSHRERKMLNLMVEGYTDDEISECLHVGKRTLEEYIRNIPKRLNVPDISYAIDYAIEKGLVSITYA